MKNKIESNIDFQKWIDTVNHASKLCDLQDDFAYSTQSDLLGWFIDMTQNEKEKAIFSIQKAMGSSTLFDFMREYVNHRVTKQYYIETADLDKERNIFEVDKYTFEKEKNDLTLTIDNLRHQNSELIKDNDKMQIDYANTIKNVWRLESEVEELQAENDRLHKFEGHIQSLLKS